jgi:pimeloyl-ACP methyl ester carboxylesterase
MAFSAGVADAMVSLDDMRRYDPMAETIPETGHNAHVERPDKVWALFESFAQTHTGRPA